MEEYRPGELAQQVSVHTGLAEGHSSVPSTLYLKVCNFQ